MTSPTGLIFLIFNTESIFEFSGLAFGAKKLLGVYAAGGDLSKSFNKVFGTFA